MIPLLVPRHGTWYTWGTWKTPLANQRKSLLVMSTAGSTTIMSDVDRAVITATLVNTDHLVSYIKGDPDDDCLRKRQAYHIKEHPTFHAEDGRDIMGVSAFGVHLTYVIKGVDIHGEERHVVKLVELPEGTSLEGDDEAHLDMGARTLDVPLAVEHVSALEFCDQYGMLYVSMNDTRNRDQILHVFSY